MRVGPCCCPGREACSVYPEYNYHSEYHTMHRECSEAQRKEGLYEVTTREDRDVGVGKSVTDRMHGRNLNTRANPNIVPPCTS
jgi:hypothetical protein